jgi:D-glucuronyl C5-epimerase C-terminus
MLSALIVAAALPAAPATHGTVLVLDGGKVQTRQELATPSLPRRPRLEAPGTVALALAAPARAARRSVPGELARLRRTGKITSAEHARRRAAWARALRTLRRLRGWRHRELAAVVTNVRLLAARKQLRASRLPAVFLQLERNREWWAKGPRLRYGQRVGFARSELLFEAFPGQGLSLHVLGNFGKANGFWQGGARYRERLRHLLRELAPLGAWRAGRRTWEYYFRFNSSSVAWASGIAQGTAIQAWARAGRRFHDPAMTRLARQGLEIFRVGPPVGLRIRTKTGSHYLIYSSKPKLRVINAFAQALNGLWTVWKITGSRVARDLYRSGEKRFVRELPHYDTGSWSLYDGKTRSSLSYHVLLRDFLNVMCRHTHRKVVCGTAARFTRYLKHG